MTKWEPPYVPRTAELVPALLEQVEAGTGDESVWRELWTMLCIEGETLVPGSLAALPRLVALARSETQALDMAGGIVRSAMTDDQGERMFVESPDAIAELRELVDQRLRTRPTDYIGAFAPSSRSKGSSTGVPSSVTSATSSTRWTVRTAP
ncbi:hypothetical protein [Streptomyces kurssanovii]|uniref:Uncharacterized protein n=1 Tax=Streptomyces kurssanovii TaxID=67312 RepID=A0ABV3HZG3_9ACTN